MIEIDKNQHSADTKRVSRAKEAGRASIVEHETKTVPGGPTS